MGMNENQEGSVEDFKMFFNRLRYDLTYYTVDFKRYFLNGKSFSGKIDFKLKLFSYPRMWTQNFRKIGAFLLHSNSSKKYPSNLYDNH